MHFSDYLRSDLLTRAGFVHAFFTRRGGVSTGPYVSLNASPEVGDRAEHVAENLNRVAALLGVAQTRLYVPRQVHGNAVFVLDETLAPDNAARAPADAIVSQVAGVACAVRTADCVPLLLADRDTRRVAAVHAGWRGVVSKVVQQTVDVMVQLGSRPGALIAAVGPHISRAAFEVGEDVARELAAASTANDVVEHLPGQRPHVDLARIIVAQLVAAGLPGDALEQVAGCTYGDEASFFSYRRDGRYSGRMLSAIVSKAGPCSVSECAGRRTPEQATSAQGA